MGNCCEVNSTLTDNQAENLIRECLTNLKIRKYGFEEFDEVITYMFKVSLVEISSDSIPKWISFKNYTEILDTHVFRTLNQSISESSHIGQKYTCPTYQEISLDENKLFFFFWAIALTKTKSKTEKVKAIEKIITSNFNMLTISTFKNFLTAYLNFVLVKLTNNFDECEIISKIPEIRGAHRRLVNKIFNVQNLENYVNEKIENIVRNYMLKKRDSLDNGKYKEEYGNEFLNFNLLINFFRENSFLLDVLELRNHFYSQYSSLYDNS